MARVAHHGHPFIAVVGTATLIRFLFWLRRRIREGREQETLRSLLAAHPGKEEQVQAITKDGYKLSETDAELQSDREVVKTALLKSGMALQFAAKELRADPSLVKIAVAQDGYALQYADDLSNNREVVKVACAQNGYALQYASKELRSDKEVVLLAVSQVPYAFQHASDKLRSDASIVKTVVGKRGKCLEFASEALRKDREIVKKAVANDCNALRYASEEFQADPELQRVAKKAEARNVLVWAGLMTMGRFFAIVQNVKLKFSGGEEKIDKPKEIDRNEEALEQNADQPWKDSLGVGRTFHQFVKVTSAWCGCVCALFASCSFQTGTLTVHRSQIAQSERLAQVQEPLTGIW